MEVEGRAEEKGEDQLSLNFITIEEVPQPFRGGMQEGLHEHSQREGRRTPRQGVCMGKQKRRESRPTGDRGCPCIFAHAGMKYYILRHGSLHFPPTSLRSGGLDPDSPHPVSCPWKALLFEIYEKILIYFKAHRQKQERQLSLDAGRKGLPWETV